MTSISSRPMSPRHRSALQSQNGFTLLEMLVVVTLLGIAGAIFSTNTSMLITSSNALWTAQQDRNNFKILQAHLDYADTNAGAGSLLDPQTYGDYNNSPINLTSTDAEWVAFREIAQNRGLILQNAASDGSPAQKLKVYQKYSTTRAVPIDGIAGETVTLAYDVGAVYQTQCRIDESCNDALPSDTTALTAANFTTWTTAGTDSDPLVFSTYQIQYENWLETYSRITTLISKMNSYVNLAILSNPGDAQTNNLNIAPSGAGALDLSGQDAATNQNCYDGWYPLNDANVNILDQLGLTESTYSSGFWGGRIDYCRDYDPALEGEGTGVHAMALRIHGVPTSGSAPSATASENRFFTF